ncbi:MAG: hypothetical protein Q9182_000306 [Xanthomendoza sp. 2 TL-2023]
MLVTAAPSGAYGELERRQSFGKMVFAHFMVGIVSGRTSAADYDNDMLRAKSAGIDAFALNIGTDTFTDQQLGYAYQSAAKNGMKVFISFDFNWWKTSQAAHVGAKVKQYAVQDAQLKVGPNSDQVFVSSFAGDGLDLDAVRSAAGVPLFIAANFQASNAANGDGAFNWMAWPSNGANKAPSASSNVTVEDGDRAYGSALGGKPYVAPVSPWFSTHYGAEVSYSKNWVFPADLLWYDRWTEILKLAPQYVEIITWNDYGEPHNGWLEMAQPFIAAYKAGSKSVGDYIKSDQIIYWYRPTPKSANCDSTDNTIKPVDDSTGNYFQGRPNGAETVSDSVFIVALLIEAGTVHVSSGSNSQTFAGKAGVNAWVVDMGVGKQSFSLVRGESTVLSGTSLKDISDGCICGIYNFNAYVGTLPSGKPDALQSPDAFQGFTSGLSPGICQPTPSLGTAPVVETEPSGIARKSTNNTSALGVTTTPSSSSLTTPGPLLITTSSLSSTAQPSASTTHAPTTTVLDAGGRSNTVTALSQLFPTNCIQPGQVWAGPTGSDTPARCDVR